MSTHVRSSIFYYFESVVVACFQFASKKGHYFAQIIPFQFADWRKILISLIAINNVCKNIRVPEHSICFLLIVVEIASEIKTVFIQISFLVTWIMYLSEYAFVSEFIKSLKWQEMVHRTLVVLCPNKRVVIFVCANAKPSFIKHISYLSYDRANDKSFRNTAKQVLRCRYRYQFYIVYIIYVQLTLV